MRQLFCRIRLDYGLLMKKREPKNNQAAGKKEGKAFHHTNPDSNSEYNLVPYEICT